MFHEEIWQYPHSITTIANFIAIAAFVVETFIIFYIKAKTGAARIGYAYIDYFTKKSYLMIILIRLSLIIVTLPIFALKSYDYRYASAIFHLYLPFFICTIVFFYIHLRGYIDTKKAGQ